MGDDVRVYKRNGEDFLRLPNLDTSPLEYFYDVKFNPDGNYLAAISYNTEPRIILYKRVGDSFVRLSAPATLPQAYGCSLAYNTKKPLLAVGSTGSSNPKPHITAYKADLDGDYAYKYKDTGDFFYENYVSFGYATEDGIAGEDLHEVINIPIK